MTERKSDVTWSLDREIVLTRVFEAPRKLVWDAWTKAEHLTAWFAPAGFTCTTREIDVRVGGRYCFDMKGPDGTLWDNRIVYLEMKEPELLVYDHGSDKDEDPGRFRVTITFDEQSDGKTVATMRQLHPTAEQRKIGIGFGAVEIGYTTMDSLTAHLKTMT